MKNTIFDIFHPGVQALYFGSVIVLTMLALHPVYVGLSFLSAVVYNVYLKGWRAMLKMLSWQLPLIAIIAVANPLFVSMGSTELFRIGHRALYVESLLYGLCMGVMLSAMMVWFSNAAQVLSTDKIMGLFGNRLPIISLMMSMIARLIPRFIDQGNEIRTVSQASSISHAQTKREALTENIRTSSVLMGWTMEDSLETASAMRARGYGAKVKRTTYRRNRFRVRDGMMLGILGILFVGNIVLITMTLASFSFYPKMTSIGFWWGYLVYAVFVLLPLAGQWVDDLRWIR